jgi:hypothetical protein
MATRDEPEVYLCHYHSLINKHSYKMSVTTGNLIQGCLGQCNLIAVVFLSESPENTQSM